MIDLQKVIELSKGDVKGIDVIPDNMLKQDVPVDPGDWKSAWKAATAPPPPPVAPEVAPLDSYVEKLNKWVDSSQPKR